YDAIVVGARCAGSPTAMLLSRNGLRVLLLDKAHFPSDTVSTHYLHQSGVARLRDWGVLDRVVASGCPPMAEVAWDIEGITFTGHPPTPEGVPHAFGPRRTVLDAILVEAAIEAGTVLRWAAGAVAPDEALATSRPPARRGRHALVSMGGQGRYVRSAAAAVSRAAQGGRREPAAGRPLLRVERRDRESGRALPSGCARLNIGRLLRV
ncbi:MAG: hypothetical protein E6G47_02340, partial [Actinobacteria bacterium]